MIRYATAFLWSSILGSLVLQSNARLVAGQSSYLLDPSPDVVYGQTIVTDVRVVWSDNVGRTSLPPAEPNVRIAMAKPQVFAEPDREEIEVYICSKPWPCREAKKVAACESSLRPTVRSKTGDSGLFQVNQVHGYSTAELLDYRRNTDIAYKLWQTQGWRPWASSKKCHKLT